MSLDLDSLEKTHEKACELLAAALLDPKHIPELCKLLTDNSVQYIKNGSLDTILELFKHAASSNELHMQSDKAADIPLKYFHSQMTLNIYNLEVRKLEHENLFGMAERSRGLRDIGAGLTTSREIFDSFLEDEGLLEDPNQLRSREEEFRFSLKLRFSELAYEAGLASILDTWPLHGTSDWHGLIDEYLSLNDNVNASLALTNALERLQAICRKVAPGAVQYFEDLKTLSNRSATLLEIFPTPHPQRLLEQIRVLVSAYQLSGQPDMARTWFLRGLDSLEGELEECEDDAARGVLLEDGDDWLGLALLVEPGGDEPYGECFKKVYRLVRGVDVPAPRVSEGVTVLRTHLTRPGCLIVKHGISTSIINRSIPAHVLFQTLEEMSRTAREEMKEFHRSGRSPIYEGNWPEILSKLDHLIGLDDLLGVDASFDHKGQLIVEAEDSALEFPWTGMVLHTGCTPDAVIVSRVLDIDAKIRPLPCKKSLPLIINGFSVDDHPLHGIMNRIGAITGGDIIKVGNADEFRDALIVRPSNLIVIGCHGFQGRTTRDLDIHLSEQIIRASDLWRDITLPSASVVLNINCFGGGGGVPSIGGHSSQAQLALNSGARAVFASRWPIWLNPSEFHPYRELLEDLRLMSVDATPWQLSRLLMRFIRRIQTSGVRNWASWSLYSTSHWIDTPHV